MTEKENEIWIGKRGVTNGTSYNVLYNNHPPKIKNTYAPWSENVTFYDVLNLLIKTPNNFYKKNIYLEFEKNSVVKIPEKEKQTIEKLVRKLEKDAKEIRNLKDSLKIKGGKEFYDRKEK